MAGPKTEICPCDLSPALRKVPSTGESEPPCETFTTWYFEFFLMFFSESWLNAKMVWLPGILPNGNMNITSGSNKNHISILVTQLDVHSWENLIFVTTSWNLSFIGYGNHTTFGFTHIHWIQSFWKNWNMYQCRNQV